MRKSPVMKPWQKIVLFTSSSILSLFVTTILLSLAGLNGELFNILFFFFLFLTPFALFGLSVSLLPRIKLLTPKDENPNLKTFAKVLSVLIIVGLIASVWYSVQSLWIAPFETRINRFTIENISVATLIASGVLTLILTTVQRDIFWIARPKQGMLDERQTRERQEVFERSYAIGAFLTVGTVWGYLSNLDAIDQIKSIAVSPSSLPGHYFIPAYCLIIALFALPLVVAALKKR